MERDTKDELQEAIIKNVLEADNHNRISAITVLEQFDITELKKHYEAWIIVEVPENKDKLYEVAMGMTE